MHSATSSLWQNCRCQICHIFSFLNCHGCKAWGKLETSHGSGLVTRLIKHKTPKAEPWVTQVSCRWEAFWGAQVCWCSVFKMTVQEEKFALNSGDFVNIRFGQSKKYSFCLFQNSSYQSLLSSVSIIILGSYLEKLTSNTQGLGDGGKHHHKLPHASGYFSRIMYTILFFFLT